MSAALARLGHQVDLAVPDGMTRWPDGWGDAPFNPLPLSRVDWDGYDIMKTEFHRGFDTLTRHYDGAHPPIIAKLGSVVDRHDRPGIYFFGAERKRLLAAGIQLYLLGHGDTRGLAPDRVTHLGPVSLDASWNYLHHADVGIVLSAGPFMHNNESTKVYHYLRVGLPMRGHAVVSNGLTAEATARRADQPG